MFCVTAHYRRHATAPTGRADAHCLVVAPCAGTGRRGGGGACWSRSWTTCSCSPSRAPWPRPPSAPPQLWRAIRSSFDGGADDLSSVEGGRCAVEYITSCPHTRWEHDADLLQNSRPSHFVIVPGSFICIRCKVNDLTFCSVLWCGCESDLAHAGWVMPNPSVSISPSPWPGNNMLGGMPRAQGGCG